jgi:hypothetical protein
MRSVCHLRPNAIPFEEPEQFCIRSRIHQPVDGLGSLEVCCGPHQIAQVAVPLAVISRETMLCLEKGDLSEILVDNESVDALIACPIANSVVDVFGIKAPNGLKEPSQ